MAIVEHYLMTWTQLVCLIILIAAAFLHWQRTRHWCLLALAIGSLLMTLGAISVEVIQELTNRTRPVTLASGAIEYKFVMRLTIWWWVEASGAAVAAVGGIGAIHWAIKLRRHKPPTQPSR